MSRHVDELHLLALQHLHVGPHHRGRAAARGRVGHEAAAVLQQRGEAGGGEQRGQLAVLVQADDVGEVGEAGRAVVRVQRPVRVVGAADIIIDIVDIIDI